MLEEFHGFVTKPNEGVIHEALNCSPNGLTVVTQLPLLSGRDKLVSLSNGGGQKKHLTDLISQHRSSHFGIKGQHWTGKATWNFVSQQGNANGNLDSKYKFYSFFTLYRVEQFSF